MARLRLLFVAATVAGIGSIHVGVAQADSSNGDSRRTVTAVPVPSNGPQSRVLVNAGPSAVSPNGTQHTELRPHKPPRIWLSMGYGF